MARRSPDLRPQLADRQPQIRHPQEAPVPRTKGAYNVPPPQFGKCRTEEMRAASIAAINWLISQVQERRDAAAAANEGTAALNCEIAQLREQLDCRTCEVIG